jgi:hypothetical protein
MMDVYAGGAVQTHVTSALWSCAAKNTQPEIINDPVWTSRTSTTTYSAGVAYPGLDLESKESNDTSHKLTYNFSANTSICGNNNVPTLASLIREK